MVCVCVCVCVCVFVCVCVCVCVCVVTGSRLSDPCLLHTVKVPFALTLRFKDMLQRGIDISTLDPSYVSTLSWYFIVMFGLRGVMQLVMGDNNSTCHTPSHCFAPSRHAAVLSLPLSLSLTLRLWCAVWGSVDGRNAHDASADGHGWRSRGNGV